MTTVAATDPNGKTHTRHSKKRTYTHAVFAIIDAASYAAAGNGDAPGGYVCIGWCGSLKLAERLAGTTRALRYPRTCGSIYTDVLIINARAA